MNRFMKQAVDEAMKGLDLGSGGPFGAVVVRNGKVIARGHNEVLSSNDPTAHAEMLAIRRASAKLGRFDLSDCEIYCTGEPCPMCYSAIFWARMEKVYYGCSTKDAAKLGFDDKQIYEAIKGGARSRVAAVQLDREGCMRPFREWSARPDRKMY